MVPVACGLVTRLRALLAAVAVLGGVLGASGAGAQTATAVDLDAIAEELNFRGYHVDPDRPEDFEDLEALQLGPGTGNYVVLLGDDVAEAADLVAEQLRGRIEEEATVMVVVGTRQGQRDVGAVSDRYGDDAIAAGLDAAAGAAGGDGAALAAAFFGSLDGTGPDAGAGDDGAAAEATAGDDGASEGSGAGAPGATEGDGGGGGIGFFPILLVLVALGVLGWFLLKRKAKRHDTGELERARAELSAQLATLATVIVENEDRINVSGNETAIGHFREANTTYNAVAERLKTVDNLVEMAELDDRLDRARWQLDAAEALVEGRAVPPEPTPDAPRACFFDPTHRPATVEAEIRTSAGSKDVMVCQSCATRLERGERPEPRMIDVNGRRVPAATAPRSHGGLGMGGLSIFAIILKVLGGLGGMAGGGGGMGGGLPGRIGSASSPVDIDWTGHLPSRRPSRGGSGSSGPFGPERLPSRPPGLPRTRISKGPAAGRGRRRM